MDRPRRSLCSILGAAALSFVLSISPSTASPSETVIHSFAPQPVGVWNPETLIPDRAGGFFGAAVDRGRGGAIFRLTPPVEPGEAWRKTVLHAFRAADDGDTPVGRLTLDESGAIYGATSSGGTGDGTVFRLTPPTREGAPWTETVLYRFQGGADGATPLAGLLIDPAGVLYGTTSAGGGSCLIGTSVSSLGDRSKIKIPCGTVFKLAPTAARSGIWTETVLYRFRGAEDGAGPAADLTMDKAGVLYGTTVGGGNAKCLPIGSRSRLNLGSESCGVAFSLTPATSSPGSWREAVLYRFAGGSDGAEPQSALTIGQAGTLYGTTTRGGSESPNCLDSELGCGTLFQLTPPAKSGSTWSERVLVTFGPFNTGSTPVGDVLIDGAGTLYGVTASIGAVFAVQPPAQAGDAWTPAVLFNFTINGGTDAVPSGGLIRDDSGRLFGTTWGTPFGDAGAVFELKPQATVGGAWQKSDLVSFSASYTDGATPSPAGLVTDKNGNLYGQTVADGSRNGGEVFELTRSAGDDKWREILLAPLSQPDSVYAPGLAWGKSDKTLFGTTDYGGPLGNGTVFALNAPAMTGGAWTQTVLHAFTGGPDGSNPGASPTVDDAGNVYGTTVSGGAHDNGTVFRLTPPGTPGQAWHKTILHSFDRFDAAPGAPQGPVLIDASGALFGTTTGVRGDNYTGTVFKLTPPASDQTEWRFETLDSFCNRGCIGLSPSGPLIPDGTGGLYGTTESTIFRLVPPVKPGAAWRAATLHAFGLYDSGPIGLVLDGSGTLYGTVSSLESNFCGAAFKLTPPTKPGATWAYTNPPRD